MMKFLRGLEGPKRKLCILTYRYKFSSHSRVLGSYLSDHYRANYNWTRLASYTFAIVAILGSLNSENAPYPKDSDAIPYTVDQVATHLRNALKPIRETLVNTKSIPLISVRQMHFPNRGRSASEPVETQVLYMQFSVINSNVRSLLDHWLIVFGESPESIRKHMSTIDTFLLNKEQSNFPLLNADKTCSMTISKYFTDDGLQVGVSIFKDWGFNKKDLSSIVNGYSACFSDKETSSGKKEDRDRVALDEDKFGKQKDSSGQHQVLIQRQPFFRVFDKLDESNGDDKPSISTNSADPLASLKALGVEVFDRSNAEIKSWDSLVGYDHVKSQIEETLTNALKYPDVYDQVARNTRVEFESNRPKAVLLEGPPGTGKTLTARIIASQCERPLVIIRLESIVSKWYGDSEKKLSKILDACEKLEGGAIVFVDEVDALAQSRDSAQGIHEASKRVLSVLLQRLEGFHGKSPSILLCATNRKNDLDKALLSRFDLAIQFDLPDHATRKNIFERYAKQFSTNRSAYESLAAASTGMSCRDIKEACQQAERIFASRIIKQQLAHRNASIAAWFSSPKNPDHDPSIKPESIKVSGTPELDDYMQSLRQKMLLKTSTHEENPVFST